MTFDAVEPSVECRFASDGVSVVCSGFGQKNEKWNASGEMGKMHASYSMKAAYHLHEDDRVLYGEADASLESAIELAKVAVRRCKILKARLDRPRDKIVRVLEVRTRMLHMVAGLSDRMRAEQGFWFWEAIEGAFESP